MKSGFVTFLALIAFFSGGCSLLFTRGLFFSGPLDPLGQAFKGLWYWGVGVSAVCVAMLYMMYLETSKPTPNPKASDTKADLPENLRENARVPASEDDPTLGDPR